MIPNEAVEAARPFVESFMKRRGFALRGKEADVLIGYVLEAAAPHMLTEAQDEAVESAIRYLLKGMREWAGDREIGFMEGALSAAKDVAALTTTNPYRSQP